MLEDISRQLQSLYGRLRSGALPIPTVGALPSGETEGSTGNEITKDSDYFSIVLNEMFLQEGRDFWVEYDPMAFVVVEFLYSGSYLSVPTIVSPRMIGSAPGELPHGILINDLTVAGPHPFRGGKLKLTVVLYKVKRHDYARRLLGLLKGVSSAVGVPANIAMLTSVGSTIVDGLEGMLEMGDTVPIAGHFAELTGETVNGLQTASFVLLADNQTKVSDLTAEKGRLVYMKDKEPFRASDYILYSLKRLASRGDEQSLPLYKQVMQTIACVNGEEEGWARAKANLLALYQQIATSPDLTNSEGERLFTKFRDDLLAKKRRVEEIKILSVKELDINRDALDPDARRLNENTIRNILNM